ncbi:uncharacterized protein [Euphorbia lathyris]|uniref:uncharacterized protein n=1 Tax=Euphorbia lathyris TaxID=212925 RepID=UPI0033134D22
MGNCLVHQQNQIKIMKPDGKILEYKTPTIVHQVLSDFPTYAVSDSSFPPFHYLLPHTQLIPGNFYYLIPLPLSSPKSKKKVRFSIPEQENKQETQEEEVVRIKVIISKQELQEILLQNGGLISVNHMVSKLQQVVQKIDSSDDGKNWKPVLESIPELGEIRV